MAEDLTLLANYSLAFGEESHEDFLDEPLSKVIEESWQALNKAIDQHLDTVAFLNLTYFHFGRCQKYLGHLVSQYLKGEREGLTVSLEKTALSPQTVIIRKHNNYESITFQGGFDLSNLSPTPTHTRLTVRQYDDPTQERAPFLRDDEDCTFYEINVNHANVKGRPVIDGFFSKRRKSYATKDTHSPERLDEQKIWWDSHAIATDL